MSFSALVKYIKTNGKEHRKRLANCFCCLWILPQLKPWLILYWQIYFTQREERLRGREVVISDSGRGMQQKKSKYNKRNVNIFLMGRKNEKVDILRPYACNA
jgi:hypothetical protein